MKVTKSLLRTAARYLARLQSGERIMRDANGHLQWASGKPAGPKTVKHMLNAGDLAELDTDLFGDRSRGQTLGIEEN